MKPSILTSITVLLAVLVMAGTSGATPTVLTFDDVTTSGFELNVLNDNGGYNGFTWHSLGVMDTRISYATYGYANAATSGNYAAFNWNPGASITSQDYFTFLGANFTSAESVFLDIVLYAYRDSELLYWTKLLANSSKPTKLEVSWSGINEIIFGATVYEPVMRMMSSSASMSGDLTPPDSGGYFSLDNVAISFGDNTASAPVPEPATMVLLGLGLIGLGGIARKKHPHKPINAHC